MRRLIWRISLTCVFLVAWGALPAQIPKLKIKAPEIIPNLDDILNGEPPITTGLQDAVTEVPFLDDYDPKVLMPMTMLPRTPEGAFFLERTGDFEFEAQSYCLKAGTYAPGASRGGEGYLHAPHKGPLSDVVLRLLQKSYAHPEIPQKDIQVLLWAIVARTKFSDLSRQNQITAAKLLSPEDIYRINGGAAGLIPQSLKDKAFGSLPPAVRRIMDAEARMRDMLTKTQASYEELERVAVLSGDPPAEKEDREVPQGRWSFHPDGYFIRYFPSGYQTILIELSVPEPIQTVLDDRGRIALIYDGAGHRLGIEYDDEVRPASVPGDPAIKGYAIRSISYDYPGMENPKETFHENWTRAGWTFVGLPADRGTAASSGPFMGLPERYQCAQRDRRGLENLSIGLQKFGGGKASFGIRADRMEKIMVLQHLAAALKGVLNGSGTGGDKWVVDPQVLIKKAWQYEVCTSENASAEPRGSRSGPHDDGNGLTESLGPHGPILTFINPDGSGGGKKTFDPADGMAQPGRNGRQRLNQSSRHTDKQKCMDDARQQLEKDINKCWEKDGPGGIQPWDFWELYKCLLTYPPNKKYKCFNIYCPTLDPEKYPLFDICLAAAESKWQKAIEKCK